MFRPYIFARRPLPQMGVHPISSISLYDLLHRWNAAKMSLQQRKDRVRQKKESFLKQQQEGDN